MFLQGYLFKSGQYKSDDEFRVNEIDQSLRMAIANVFFVFFGAKLTLIVASHYIDL